MGAWQVVIVREAQQLRGLEKLAHYTQNPSPTTILVICHKEKNADKRSAFYKGAAAHGTVFESVRPRDYEIGPWLTQFAASRGFALDTKAAAMLADHLGTDIAKIANELEKLAVSVPEGTKRITDSDIETYTGISKEFNNFELCKAVLARDTERALRIAGHFARNPKEHPLLVTVMALFGQFRQLIIFPVFSSLRHSLVFCCFLFRHIFCILKRALQYIFKILPAIVRDGFSGNRKDMPATGEFRLYCLI